MHCRDISEKLFDMIAAELSNPDHRAGHIETITGLHESYGLTILLRDTTRCMALVVDPVVLDALILKAGLH